MIADLWGAFWNDMASAWRARCAACGISALIGFALLLALASKWQRRKAGRGA